jgi:hypothetical protein
MRYYIFIPAPEQDTHREFNSLWRLVDQWTSSIALSGGSLVAVEVRSCDLANPRVKLAFRSRAVPKLPALVAPGHIVAGARSIASFFGNSGHGLHDLLYDVASENYG